MKSIPTGQEAVDPAPLLVLRADADNRIGAGHIMRCLALAQEWQRQGGNAIFVGHITAGPLRMRLENAGFRVHELIVLHPDPLDMATFLPWLREHRRFVSWVVLDGYHFTPSYQQAIQAEGIPLLVIDDFAHLPIYYTDILLNPNAYAGTMSYPAIPGTRILQGGRFALLRPEFQLALGRTGDGNEGKYSRQGRRILVTMGGSDPDNVTAQVIDSLVAMGRTDLEVKIIIGPLHPHRQLLEKRLQGLPFPTQALFAVTDMVSLMNWADLAISAAGSTCWELAALGVPMAVTILADNQERVATSLHFHGAALNLGWFHDWHPHTVVEPIQALLTDRKRRCQMGERGRNLVDGMGCSRIITEMHTGG